VALESAAPLLSVQSLTIDLVGNPIQYGLVDDVTFSLGRRATLALIGESGCGKSLTAMAILGLLPETMNVSRGSVVFNGTDLLKSSRRQLLGIRGKSIGTVFQDPMSSLNPTMSVGDQIAEARRLHLGERRSRARAHAQGLLDLVGIPNAERRMRAYPFELSGGMQQRVMIAAAIACDPELIIADEPTTALDVTIQAEILDLFRGLQESMGLSVLFVTHDLGVVADFCDDVVVMYAGHVVDRAPVDGLFERPLHPYTEALLTAVPRAGRAHSVLDVIPGRVPPAGSFPTGCRFEPRCTYSVDEICGKAQVEKEIDAGRYSRCVRVALGELSLQGADRPSVIQAAAPAMDRDADRVVLRAVGLHKSFPLHRNLLGRVTERVNAVNAVDVALHQGRTLGVVGESGSGKTTLGRLLAFQLRADEGTIEFDGKAVSGAPGKQLKALRTELQVIFQDPYSALDPTKTIGHAVTEPLLVHHRARRSDVKAVAGDLLSRVALDPALASRLPDELSGGQRQRACIARALALSPRVLVADEPTSALDLSTRAEILNLLMALQNDLGLSILLVSHDFATVRHLAHDVVVMYHGRVVEEGPADAVADDPRHPYTQALMSAVPVPNPKVQRGRKRVELPGDTRSQATTGCAFRLRCPIAIEQCAHEQPPMLNIGTGRRVACIRADGTI
jgi:peptide/nickel transport system ATP-binding protein